jgi:hypothetical protein
VLPFATNCVDCQTERETEVKRTIGNNRWTSPAKIDEVLETQRSVEDGQAALGIFIDEAFGPDEEEFKKPRSGTRRRRLGQRPALARDRLADRSKVAGGIRSLSVERVEPSASRAGN